MINLQELMLPVLQEHSVEKSHMTMRWGGWWALGKPPGGVMLPVATRGSMATGSRVGCTAWHPGKWKS